MRLISIHLHNFRSVIDATIDAEPYTLLVGANNAGKSTIIDALRAFYEKDGFKYKKDRDWPHGATDDKESWIDLTFQLSTDEHDSLKDEYRLPDSRLKVRKYFVTEEKTKANKSKAGIICGYRVDDSISDEAFYGAKNVQEGKFGQLVFIPAVSKIDEHTKLSGPSALRDLLTDVLTDVVEGSASFSKFESDFSEFAETIAVDRTEDGRSLDGLQNELNSALSSWGTQFKLTLSAPSTSEIIKTLLRHDILDDVYGRPHSPDQFGSGFQRQFIFALIDIGSRYTRPRKPKKTKEFTPNMTLILFEEPEAFLHPPQQELLCKTLRDVSTKTDRQTICSTHSSHFVSKNAGDLRSIVRLERKDGVSMSFQLSDAAWRGVVDANQAINSIHDRWSKLRKKLQAEDRQAEMEAIKHCLWLNPDRCGMFFAKHALLVEGASEQALINKLLGSNSIPRAADGVYVLDCLGKFNIHRFMNLLSALGVRHSVIFDDDFDTEHHKEINELIRSSADPEFTVAIEAIRGDVERQLGVPPCKDSHRKPQHLLWHHDHQMIEEVKLKTFCTLVSETICPTASSNRTSQEVVAS